MNQMVARELGYELQWVQVAEKKGAKMNNFTVPQRHRRGNPRWASSPAYLAAVPPQPSAWDRMLYGLRLAKDDDALLAIRAKGDLAAQITQWVRQNRGRFVPEAVLDELHEKDCVEGMHWWGGVGKR